MAAKLIQVSADDAAYYTLPGNTGELTREGANIDDTIFGQSFRSGMTGIINWGVNANAVYKGFAGYMATIKKKGTSTPLTDEATTLVSGKTYQITNAAKRILNRAVAVVVEDGAVDHTADVDNIDFLFGKVTFKAAYTPGGAITVSGAYFPTVAVGKATSYTLNQTADAIDTTDFDTASGNGGFKTFEPGLRSVSIELPSVFNATDAWAAELVGRNELVLEINPDGQSKSLCRGFFRLMTDRQAGNVGALEEETLSFQLAVPLQATGPTVAIPFGWHHDATSPIPAAVKAVLTQWELEQKIYTKYLHNGAAGWKGQGVVTNFTMTGGMESMNTFAYTAQQSGAPVAV